ncbi:hypothetical protein ILUMI_00107 [Ignelater luminosus]|uniref:Uncharacterized protein n=1 Tax=Ignelater luminosus TaxID=2038154 RepID=A0A8K0DT96_IGNLU|nr:hypothetical protein ILUMI_00107 [Ignelater luminosus]
MDLKVDKEFLQAKSDNLPQIDVFMVAEFFRNDECFTASELSGVKEKKVNMQQFFHTGCYTELFWYGSNIVCTVLLTNFDTPEVLVLLDGRGEVSILVKSPCSCSISALADDKISLTRCCRERFTKAFLGVVGVNLFLSS